MYLLRGRGGGGANEERQQKNLGIFQNITPLSKENSGREGKAERRIERNPQMTADEGGRRRIYKNVEMLYAIC
jgi:hypothetical protein